MAAKQKTERELTEEIERLDMGVKILDRPEVKGSIQLVRQVQDVLLQLGDRCPGLSDQLARAVPSCGANICEALGRIGTSYCVQYYQIARGSLTESIFLLLSLPDDVDTTAPLATAHQVLRDLDAHLRPLMAAKAFGGWRTQPEN